MPILAATDLSVSLVGREILHGLTLAVEDGEWVAVVGPNGTGKTTLLRTLAGLLPYRGTLLLDGRSVRDWRHRDRARRLAFVRQSQEVTFDFPVLDFVLLGRTAHRGWLEPFREEDRSAAHEALVQVELAGYEDRLMTELSGGEQQRARLAQALAQDAPLLLLDEPTAHLDVHHQLDLMNRIRGLVAGGRTVITAVHDLVLASRYADRLLVLHEGRLAANGSPAAVLTPELLRSVFRVHASIDPAAPDSIRFLSPA